MYGLFGRDSQRKMGLGRKTEAHQVLTTISASEPPLMASRSMSAVCEVRSFVRLRALTIQGLFEFCVRRFDPDTNAEQNEWGNC